MKIVLTAPATEMSEYNGNPAMGFSAGFPKPLFIPRRLLLERLYKPVPKYSDHRVKYAPLGLRIIEASLVESGFFTPSDIAIVHPDDLGEVINDETKVVGIGAKDPLGLGYVSLTYSAIIGLGDPMNKYEFDKLIKTVKSLRKRYKFHVVLGGPGVWQVTRFSDLDKLGITCIVSGEGEEVAPVIFAKLSRGESVEMFVEGGVVDPWRVPVIRGASIYGAVEITRGCGRGCAFCSPTMVKKRDMPLDKVLRDIEINIKNEQYSLLLVTEDLFLYGATSSFEPNDVAVLRLIEKIVSYGKIGLERIQVTHLNLAAVLYKRELFRKISSMLGEYAWFKLGNSEVVTTEVGIETGSSRLIRTHMAGKPRPFKPELWPRVVIESLILMEESNWVPCATLIVGLPGETYQDAYETLRLVEEIDELGLRTFLVPLLFVPLGNCRLRSESLRRFEDLMDIQLEIFVKCWKHNIKYWGPEHFKNYGDLEKVIVRILGLIYRYVASRRRRWRRFFIKEIYDEIIKQIDMASR